MNGGDVVSFSARGRVLSPEQHTNSGSHSKAASRLTNRVDIFTIDLDRVAAATRDA